MARDEERGNEPNNQDDKQNRQSASIIPVEHIQNRILLIRGQKVILDSDLAELYGVLTKRLNEQVKRNTDRFPPDFMFQLSEPEKAAVVARCDHLQRLKFSPVLPYAFTEHGSWGTAAARAGGVCSAHRFLRRREIVKCVGATLQFSCHPAAPFAEQ